MDIKVWSRCRDFQLLSEVAFVINQALVVGIRDLQGFEHDHGE
jgi:hypothetical protein